MKRVSVIVPTFRDAEGLALCLAALRAQTYPAASTEILVIDNTPEFELREKAAAFAPARLLHAPSPGSYAARNRGIAAADGDILAFTDADCLPGPTWIEEGVRALERHPEGALIAGRIEVFARDPRRPTAVELFEISQAFPQQRYATVGRFGATANVFVPRKVIEAVGPFDATLASGGDGEFGQRVHAAGFPVVYAEEVAVRHPARRAIGELLGKTRRVARGAHDLERAGQLPKGSFARGLLRDLRPPVQTCWNLLRDPRLGGLGGVKAAGVMVFWRYYRAGYRLSLLMGGARS
jgi:GT2 family glycosyltransferase